VRPVLLLLFTAVTAVFCAEKTVIDIQHRATGKNRKATVITPDLYHASDDHFSVIYLLHGYNKDHTAWPSIVPLETLSDTYGFIFVSPDGGRASWYVDSPRRKRSQFASYIGIDVVETVDSLFRTHRDYMGRALIGSSMGGHGALTILARHVDTFYGASGISAIVDLTAFPDQWEIERVLGGYSTNSARWEEHSFSTLYRTLQTRDRAILLDCGLRDFALPGNRALHDAMAAIQMNHEFYVRPGDHSSRYVAGALEYHLLYFSKKLLPPGR